jgi:hypothetical protein
MKFPALNSSDLSLFKYEMILEFSFLQSKCSAFLSSRRKKERKAISRTQKYANAMMESLKPEHKQQSHYLVKLKTLSLLTTVSLHQLTNSHS